MNQRATSIPEFAEKMSRMRSSGGLSYAAAFRPRPDDVLIATYPKAGTTWMQQIVHGLRTGGDMDFDEISIAVPWIELAYDMGLDLEAEQAARPRAFKTHYNGDNAPGGCKVIFIVRDPLDTMVSFYNFMNGWFIEPGSISMHEFAEHLLTREYLSGSYWSHLLTWWPKLKDSDCLSLAFEDMKEDLPAAVARVAEFLELDSDADVIEIATRQASFEFMKQHERQFDDHPTAIARNADCGLPADAGSTKVGSGEVGGHKAVMEPATRALLDARWREIIELALGFEGYDDLREALKS